MIYWKNALIVSVVGIAAILSGLVIHNHILSVNAEKLSHVPPPAPYFPPGSVWYQDVSKAPVDPQSSEIIDWLADAGGWGDNNKMRVDFAIRVNQANASTPLVPFHEGVGFITPDSDLVTTVPLPAGGGAEGQKDYQCPAQDEDCHLIVADRSHGKLYEAYQSNYANNMLTASFLAVWDLNKVYPPSGRGEQCTSADAAGFPIAPLLFNADELAVWQHPPRHSLYPSQCQNAREGLCPSGYPRRSAERATFRSALWRSLPPQGLLRSIATVAPGTSRRTSHAEVRNVSCRRRQDRPHSQSDMDTTTKYADLGFSSRDMQSLKVTDFEVLEMGKPILLTYECDTE